MRNRRLKTATYYRRGRGMSLRAAQAYNEGAMPASKWSAKLGIRIEEVRILLERDSCHHTGKYAMLTDFYKVSDKKKLAERAKDIVSERKKKFWDFLNENREKKS